ncbi:VCBS repeat-containing protein [Lacibacter sp. H375]|uniref:VCBS repeat-containing protein n=1 Tax=Lacibacter sp. H375 TaxID=3133424 RepID=UPI0030C03B8C
MKKVRIVLAAAVSNIFLFYSCSQNKIIEESPVRFTEMPSSQTGITFNNAIIENDSVNLLVNEYTYMGSGAGVGDFNNDGLPDVFFAATQSSAKLYINKGDFRFKDITQTAGITTDYWATGVSVADINNDGFDDIYVCATGSKDPEKRRNRLYINNGNLTFSEQAKEYGLADTSLSTQAAFFDYDGDGDLDMYLLNHSMYEENMNNVIPADSIAHPIAADKLYRNETLSNGHPVFKDVSVEAGIKEIGYGLGIAISDLNNDNRPDIYIANDYIVNDKLWLNNGNGSFRNAIASSIKHQSYSSMGVDAADINNDGLIDIATLDMLPEDNERKKMMYAAMDFYRYELERKMKYESAFMRNMLQLNNGVRTTGNTTEPFFSEIGQLAGIHETDWSWSVLIADFDNDGWKDMHITNGFGKNMLNNDFLQFQADAKLRNLNTQQQKDSALRKKLDEYGSRQLPNYFFRNNGNLSFSNLSEAAGIITPTVSNGCVYADFDNDGDLDLMTNNINQQASVLRNELITSKNDTASHYLKIKLQGDSLNRNGFGAVIKLYSKGKLQIVEQAPVRGYASTVDKIVHFGLGKETVVDSLIITWPDNKEQALYNLQCNKLILLKQKDASRERAQPMQASPQFFTDITGENVIDFKHRDSLFFDYGIQGLLPQKFSQLGPFIAEADVNGDGLTDFFAGGAFFQSGQIFTQQSNGFFTSAELIKDKKIEEDLGSLFFDADGDNDVDLFINSGSNEFPAGSTFYSPRLFRNNGKGLFSLDANAFPKTLHTSAQAVAGADYDADGDIDLFIGGRIIPTQYPLSPFSYILQNNGTGTFTDVTQIVCQALHDAGMITSAVWTDFNADKKPDLIIAGEWTKIRFFKNTGQRLEEVTETTGLQNMSGQWRSLAMADLDNDGDFDIVAGNLGLNNRYKASAKEPMKLFAKDLDDNGNVDPLIAYYISNQKGERHLYPAIDRQQFAVQVPSIKKKYQLHEIYSKAKMEDIIKEYKEGMLELTCEETRTCWLENKGNGKFELHALPIEAQFSPVNSIVCTDVNGDKKADIILAGNEYQAEVMTGRYDASYGLLLMGDGKGTFKPVSPLQSGLIIDGDVKDMKIITTASKERLLLVAVNNDRMKIFRLKK